MNYKKETRKRIILILILVLGITIAGTGCYFYLHSRADTSHYIGMDEALSIALNDAGTTEDLVYDSAVNLQYAPRAVYDVEFTSIATHYVYGIDAQTGQILLTGVTE